MKTVEFTLDRYQDEDEHSSDSRSETQLLDQVECILDGYDGEDEHSFDSTSETQLVDQESVSDEESEINNLHSNVLSKDENARAMAQVYRWYAANYSEQYDDSMLEAMSRAISYLLSIEPLEQIDYINLIEYHCFLANYFLGQFDLINSTYYLNGATDYLEKVSDSNAVENALSAIHSMLNVIIKAQEALDCGCKVVDTHPELAIENVDVNIEQGETQTDKPEILSNHVQQSMFAPRRATPAQITNTLDEANKAIP